MWNFSSFDRNTQVFGTVKWEEAFCLCKIHPVNVLSHHLSRASGSFVDCVSCTIEAVNEASMVRWLGGISQESSAVVVVVGPAIFKLLFTNKCDAIFMDFWTLCTVEMEKKIITHLK